MILSILAATPIVGALVLALMPRGTISHLPAKIVALGVSLVALALSLAVLAQYEPADGGYQLTEQHTWIKAFGAHYAVGVNGIAVTLVLLTTILVPIVILASFDDRLPDPKGTNAYFAWMLAVEGLALGAFMDRHVRRAQPVVRRGQVLDLQPRGRPADARRDRRAVRRQLASG
jgi:NADH-quinone oxidoreductase subunit M